MRKLLILPLVAFAFSAFGQNTPAPPPGAPMPIDVQRQQSANSPNFVVPVQMGTETLLNGRDTVMLEESVIQEMLQAQASPQYSVMLTAKGEGGQIAVAETNEKYFLVKQRGAGVAGSNKIIFDYVVFAKQKRPFSPGHTAPHPGGNGSTLPPH